MVLVLGLKSTRALLEHLCLQVRKVFRGVTEKLHLNGACEFSKKNFIVLFFKKQKAVIFLVILLYIAVYETFENEIMLNIAGYILRLTIVDINTGEQQLLTHNKKARVRSPAPAGLFV